MRFTVVSAAGRPRGSVFERLEERRLLAYAPGPVSAQVGNDLFYVEAVGGDAVALFKSDLNGSNPVRLETWASPGPSWLTAHDGELFFSANYPLTSYSGNELWKSDGTPGGTVMVRDIYGGSLGSWPYDFKIIDNHLIFTASNNSSTEQIFGTDGTRDGTVQLLTPGAQFGYYGSPISPTVVGNRIVALLHNDSKDQYELWQTNGTPAGTSILTASAMIWDGALHVYGTNGNDTINVSAPSGQIAVTINGVNFNFDDDDFSGILISAQDGHDAVQVNSAVTQNVSIIGGLGNDTLGGGSGDDSITDHSGSDSMVGGAGDDYLSDSGDDYDRPSNTLRGGDGDDTLSGNWGDDLLDGGDGHDSISSGFGNDTVIGGSGNDTLDGGSDDDTLIGGSGNDVLTDPSGNNSLQGDNGNDSLSGAGGDDTLDGGAGVDTMHGGRGLDLFVSDPSDLITDEPQLDLQSGVLDVSGTHGNDLIVIRLKSGSSDVLEVILNSGLTGEFDLVDITQVRVATGKGNDTITIHSAVPIRAWLLGGVGNDTISGSAGADTIEGGEGNDSLSGQAGDDLIYPGLGNDVVDGGAGVDRLYYTERQERLLKTDGNAKSIRTDAGEVDTFGNLEGVVLGDGNDVFVSNRAVDGLSYISGRKGNDSINVSSAASVPAVQVYGEEGNDTLTGLANDSLDGGAGDNTILLPAASAPALSATLIGGILRVTGTEVGDQIALVRSPSMPHRLKVIVNGQVTVFTVNDITSAIIHGLDGADGLRIDQRYGEISFGTRMYGEGGSDTMVGGNGSDRMYGGDGDDWIGGQGGNDVMYGESGNDRLFGGEGRDYLVGGLGLNVLRGENGVDQIVARAGEDDFRGNQGDLITLIATI